MPLIDEKTVDYLAKLAHLELRADEKDLFARHLQQILSYAESLQSLPTSDVPPMSHASSAEIFREDAVDAELPRETALREAPDHDSGLFRVPRVIGG